MILARLVRHHHFFIMTVVRQITARLTSFLVPESLWIIGISCLVYGLDGLGGLDGLDGVNQFCISNDLMAVIIFECIPLSMAGFYELLHQLNTRWSMFKSYKIQSHVSESRALQEQIIKRDTIKLFWSHRISFGLFYYLFRNQFMYQWPHMENSVSSQSSQNHCALPSINEVLLHLGLTLVVNDCFFYAMHRLFHHPRLYKWHKEHHEFTNPMGWAAIRGSGIEFLFWLLPMTVGPILLLKMHRLTIVLWALIGTSHTYYVHSGFDFPVKLCLVPFAARSSIHDRHHSHNNCNYGLYWTFWDCIFKSLTA